MKVEPLGYLDMLRLERKARAILTLTGVQVTLAGILAEILIRIHFAQNDRRRVYRLRRVWDGEGEGR